MALLTQLYAEELLFSTHLIVKRRGDEKTNVDFQLSTCDELVA